MQTGGYNSAGYAVEGRVIDGNVKASSTVARTVSTTPVTATTGDGQLDRREAHDVELVRGGTAGRVQGLHPDLHRRPATKAIPEFTYNPANYTPAPLEFASTSAFQTYVNAHKNT